MIYYLGDSTITAVDGAHPEDGTLGWCVPLTAWLSLPVTNLGVGAQTLYGVLAGSGNPDYINPSYPHAIRSLAAIVADMQSGDALVLECGINDYDEADVASGMDSAVSAVSGHVLILQTPTRASNNRYAEIAGKAAVIRSKALQYGLPLIDMQYGVTVNTPYGVHPDQAGYEIMGRYANMRLNEIFNPAVMQAKHKRAAEAACL